MWISINVYVWEHEFVCVSLCRHHAGSLLACPAVSEVVCIYIFYLLLKAQISNIIHTYVLYTSTVDLINTLQIQSLGFSNVKWLKEGMMMCLINCFYLQFYKINMQNFCISPLFQWHDVSEGKRERELEVKDINDIKWYSISLVFK